MFSLTTGSSVSRECRFLNLVLEVGFGKTESLRNHKNEMASALRLGSGFHEMFNYKCIRLQKKY